MLKIEKFVTPSPEQWEIIIEGMRNPKNSWGRMDTGEGCKLNLCNNCSFKPRWCGNTPVNKIGPNDHTLMDQLNAGGPVHAKYRRMIPVWVTLTAPLYWWKEFDTYKVGTVCNSCSTMHKIQAKEFTREDFSCERLSDIWDFEPEIRDMAPVIEFETKTDKTTNYVLGPDDILDLTIKALNRNRELYNKTHEKCYWENMIQLLPSSYNQKRTVMLNYEVLVNIYQWRRNHKLDEWHVFCSWIESLPHSELITGKV